MQFVNQYALWLLLLLPIAGVMAVWLAWQRKRQMQEYFGEDKLVNANSKPLSAEAYQVKAALVFIALAALILAIARPVLDAGTSEFPQGTVDVIAVVDTSRSMAALDYENKIPGEYFTTGTRLNMARYLILKDLVPALNSNRLGVVTYAGEAFPQAFLTDDVPALGWIMKRTLTIGSAPGDGSNLLKAFKLAFQLFDLDSDPKHHKIIVLFSDGGSDDGDKGLSDIIQACRNRRIEIVVVGMGRTVPSPIPLSELTPQDRYEIGSTNWNKKWWEENGQVVTTALDEHLLQYFANRAGGSYIRLEDPSEFNFVKLVSEVEMLKKKGTEELFWYPLIIAFIAMVLTLFTAREVKPKSGSN